MGLFEGKVALVTGGTSGIGHATAVAFAREGAKVVVSGRREKEGGEVVAEIVKNGGEAIFVKTDITIESDVKVLVDKTIEAFGRLDYAFNNAGVEQSFTPLADQTEDDYKFVMDTNVKGVWLSMKYEIPAILANGGAIVNTSSIAGLIGMATIPLYIASKHAVIGLTKSLAIEYGKQGIRINAVLPAAIETPMFDRFASTPETQQYMASLHPIGRVGKAEEIADAVIWLCSDKSSFVTGTSLIVDGGFTAQ